MRPVQPTKASKQSSLVVCFSSRGRGCGTRGSRTGSFSIYICVELDVFHGSDSPSPDTYPTSFYLTWRVQK